MPFRIIEDRQTGRHFNRFPAPVPLFIDNPCPSHHFPTFPPEVKHRNMLDMISDPTVTDRPDWAPDSAISWLLTEGRFNDSVRGAFDSFMQRLSEDGAPIGRSALIIATLHPLIRGWGLRWTRRNGTGLEASFYHATQNTPAYLLSPIHHVFQESVYIRRRLNTPDARFDYPVLQEMKDQGYTDYLASPLIFSDGAVSVLTFCTEKPEGWTDNDLLQIDRLSAALAPVIEAISARRTAQILMETYIGKRSGRKVLDGHIRRGDGETINAVVWFNDLRDSTALSEELPMNRMLALLNTYFEISALAIQNNGGEVLRFVGDAMLGIFPVSDDTGGETAAAERALRAAFQTRDNMTEANAERRRNTEPPINFGIGLHIGEVMYGNVGAPARLDFSVIGPAANRAARVESLTRELGIPLLTSSAFAAISPLEMASAGLHRFKGIADMQEVFTLPEFLPHSK